METDRVTVVQELDSKLKLLGMELNRIGVDDEQSEALRLLHEVKLTAEKLKEPVEREAAKQSEAVEREEAMKKRELGMKKREVAQKSEAVGREAAMKKPEEEMKKREAARKRYKGKGKAVFMTKEEKLKLELDNYLEWKKKKEAEKCDPTAEEVADPYAFEARSFKQTWEENYGSFGYGNFDDTTSRFMLNSRSGAVKRESLQMISVKVLELTGGLQWPLDVYGFAAVRDSYDHKRNFIFERVRENCQTLTAENPYLVLTGPMRVVVLCDYVVFEVSLYVRGTANSDDKELSLLAVSCGSPCCPPASFLTMRSYTSRLSTLDFKLGHIVSCVEATVSMKVISGPPHGFYGEFVAFTGNIKDGVVLHKSGEKELHLAGDKVYLSRSVVSVESFGKLRISVMASDGYVKTSGSVDLDPLEKGTSSGEVVATGLCKLEVNVDWSLLPLHKWTICQEKSKY